MEITTNYTRTYCRVSVDKRSTRKERIGLVGPATISTKVQAEMAQKFHAERLSAIDPKDLLPPWGEIYSDDAISGDIAFQERPDGRRLLREIKRGDHLVVAFFDRLGRNTLDILGTIDRLRKMGVVIHLLNMNGMRLSTDSPVADMLLTIMAGVAQYERHLKIQRIRESLAWRRDHEIPVSQFAPYGKVWSADGKHWIEDAEEAAWWEKIEKWYFEHRLSVNYIVRELRRQQAVTRRKRDHPMPFGNTGVEAFVNKLIQTGRKPAKRRTLPNGVHREVYGTLGGKFKPRVTEPLREP